MNKTLENLDYLTKLYPGMSYIQIIYMARDFVLPSIQNLKNSQIDYCVNRFVELKHPK